MFEQSYVEGYSYPCYPTSEQRQLLAKTFGCYRALTGPITAATMRGYGPWSALASTQITAHASL